MAWPFGAVQAQQHWAQGTIQQPRPVGHSRARLGQAAPVQQPRGLKERQVHSPRHLAGQRARAVRFLHLHHEWYKADALLKSSCAGY